MTRKPRVVVALSGGVDSSVAAALCKAEGYSVAAVFYELWAPTDKSGAGWENNCCSLEAYRDAQRVAKILGIPLYRANIAHEFKKTVVDRFVAEYAAGRTPNPCVTCNAELRFGLMLARARQVFGADYLVTGHYAIRDRADSWRASQLAKQKLPHRLLTAQDAHKDQSFFLYGLGQEQLAQILWPLGGWTKKEVRDYAAKLGLPTASKHDSQEICFVKRGGVAEFLRRQLGEQSASIVTTGGKKIGTHNNPGAVTVGQRRGLGSLGVLPRYVVAKDLRNLQITVTENPTDPHLLLNYADLQGTNWIVLAPRDGEQLTARYRPLQKPFKVQIKRVNESWRVQTLEKVIITAPGQSLVLLHGPEIVGGGVIGSVSSCAKLKVHATQVAT